MKKTLIYAFSILIVSRFYLHAEVDGATSTSFYWNEFQKKSQYTFDFSKETLKKDILEVIGKRIGFEDFYAWLSEEGRKENESRKIVGGGSNSFFEFVSNDQLRRFADLDICDLRVKRFLISKMFSETSTLTIFEKDKILVQILNDVFYDGCTDDDLKKLEA